MKKNKVKKLTIKDLEGLVSATGGSLIGGRKRWSPLPEPRTGDSRCYEEKVEGGAMTESVGAAGARTAAVPAEPYEKRKK